ncbi:MAG TPA: hypothetical protein ENI41_03395 [Deltaproteobacteria bacterium]|nr:MAG: hypothetical protein DRG83_17060 [Deltaproteobacteria bacterium]HEC31518.1 hypothetical protein [Deltaproteobacteria bacterium]
MASHINTELISFSPEILVSFEQSVDSIVEAGTINQDFSESELWETTTGDPTYEEYNYSRKGADLQRKIWTLFVHELSQISYLSPGKCENEFKSSETSESLVKEEDTLFALDIISAINAEPVEDGFSHPAEELLKKSLARSPQKTFSWLYNTVHYERNIGIVASILKCLGRVKPIDRGDWIIHIARAALEHHDVEVRDAAVQMLELLEIERAVELLEQHMKREQVGWLRDYIESVTQDLKE